MGRFVGVPAKDLALRGRRWRGCVLHGHGDGDNQERMAPRSISHRIFRIRQEIRCDDTRYAAFRNFPTATRFGLLRAISGTPSTDDLHSKLDATTLTSNSDLASRPMKRNRNLVRKMQRQFELQELHDTAVKSRRQKARPPVNSRRGVGSIRVQ